MSAQLKKSILRVGFSFYGTRLKQFLDCPLKAPMQGHFGTTDDHTPADLLEEVKAYLPDFEMYMYDAGHAFANEARASYVADAADLWPISERKLFWQRFSPE